MNIPISRKMFFKKTFDEAHIVKENPMNVLYKHTDIEPKI